MQVNLSIEVAQTTAGTVAPAGSRSAPAGARPPGRSTGTSAGHALKTTASQGVAATASPPPPPSAGRVALDVAVSLVIFALALMVVVALGAAIWSFFAWAQRSVTGQKRVFAFTDAQIRRMQGNGVLVALVLLVFLGIIWMPLNPALQANGAWITGELIEIGVMLTAGFFGFLFGLPHLNPAQGAPPSGVVPGAAPGASAPSGPLLTPSTNLERVADNVAGLIAGAALAQLITVPSYVARFGLYFATKLQLGPSGEVLGAGLILYFAPLGFVLAYIATRTIGARAFAQSDVALVNTGARVVEELPVLPDVQLEATPEQRDIAARIASMSLASMQTVNQKATWARAQSILENWKAAENAYQQALVLDDSDPTLILDYAAVLYNDLAYEDYAYILVLIDRVLALLDKKDDSDLRSRTLALRAGTNLYVPGGNYVTAITTVNEVISDPNLQPTATLRFYRACAFGQLYRGYLAHTALAAGDRDAIVHVVKNDVAITLAFGPEYKEQVQYVIDPAVRKSGGHLEADDDLQQLAIDDPQLVKMAGLKAAPPPPDPATTPAMLPLPTMFASVKDFAESCPV